MRPSLLELLLVATYVCECKAGLDIAQEGLRRRAAVTTSIIQTTATSTRLGLLTTPTATQKPLPTSISTGLDCSTTLQRPTSTCVLSNAVQKCTQTTTPMAFCKSEYLCFKNDAGQDTCRPRDNKVSPAGIAFAIIVPLVLATIAITLILLRRRERKARERQRLIRTMERDALGYASNGSVLPRPEKHQRAGVRGRGPMDLGAELHIDEGGEDFPPPAYTSRNFDSRVSQQPVSMVRLTEIDPLDGVDGGGAESGSHERSH